MTLNNIFWMYFIKVPAQSNAALPKFAKPCQTKALVHAVLRPERSFKSQSPEEAKSGHV
jgi:hypothetical protein